MSTHVKAFVIEGYVLDEAGVGIEYANISIAQSTMGTYSNLNGSFSLRLEAGEYTLRVNYVGYMTYTEKLIVNADIRNKRIVLTPSSASLNEVVINPDKAEMSRQLMKKAKAFRVQNAAGLTSLVANSYAKYSLDYGVPLVEDDTASKTNKTKPELIEIYAKQFYVAPNKYKEVIEAYRNYKYTAKGIPPPSFHFSATAPGQRTNAYGATSTSVISDNSFVFQPDKLTANFDLYQNTLDLPLFSPNPYISPLGNANFLVYDFMLEESYYEGDRKIYRMQVIPKNAASNAFYGYLLIEDVSFALIGASLSVNATSMQFFTQFSFNLEYTKVEKSYVLKSEEFTYHTKIKKGDYAYGSSLLLYDNWIVNEEISPAFMRQGQKIIKDSAEDKSQDFWETIRPQNLKTKEIAFIQAQDSVRAYEHSVEYLTKLDSATNHIDVWDIMLSGVQHVNRAKGTSFYFESLLQSIRPFAVGGYRHALSGNFTKEWTKANKLRTDYEVNYGFRNKNFKGSLAFDYTYAPKHFGSFSINGGDQYAMLNDYESIEATFSRGNYLQKYFYGIGGAYEIINGLMARLNVDYATYRSIKNVELAPWGNEIFGDLNVPKHFEGYQQLVSQLLLTFIPFQKFKLTAYKKELLGSSWPTFNLKYNKGIKPFGGSDVNYDFLEINVLQQIKLKTLGISKYEIYLGKFVNDREIRISDNKFFRGSDRYFFSDPMRSFQHLGPTLRTTNAYFQAHYIHQFNGVLLNKVPLVKKLKLEEMAGAGILLLDDKNFRHAEMYVGVGRPFRIRQQLFKLSAFYVTSENSTRGFNDGFKIGLTYFDSFTKTWGY